MENKWKKKASLECCQKSNCFHVYYQMFCGQLSAGNTSRCLQESKFNHLGTLHERGKNSDEYFLHISSKTTVNDLKPFSQGSGCKNLWQEIWMSHSYLNHLTLPQMYLDYSKKQCEARTATVQMKTILLARIALPNQCNAWIACHRENIFKMLMI